MKTFKFKPKRTANPPCGQLASSNLANICIPENRQSSGRALPINRPITAVRTAILPDFDSMSGSAFIRLPTVTALFACSRATIWRWVKDSKFPAPRKLGPRIVAWNVSEIRQALAAHMGEVQS